MNYNNNYENTSQRDKRAVLEHAALTKSPEEIAALCRQLGHVENSARALGLACRFRGLSYVKALVEGGADFTYKRPEDGGGYYTIDYWLAPLEMNRRNARRGCSNSKTASPILPRSATGRRRE